MIVIDALVNLSPLHLDWMRHQASMTTSTVTNQMTPIDFDQRFEVVVQHRQT